ncbi:Protein C01C10.2 b [Aphelenchoides avenae]|nr:Protein C01C10.2 b [Aphelenchus avenae]
MEDVELFSTDKFDLTTPLPPVPAEEVDKICTDAHSLWWSRLIISTRGYVINLLNRINGRIDDNQLFSTDDAFILLHKVFVERAAGSPATPAKFCELLNKLVQIERLSDVLATLHDYGECPKVPNPFREEPYASVFASIFGPVQHPKIYELANLQKYAYIVFMRVLGILMQRFQAEQTKKKGIRFDKDPEWQPDHRVVLFEQLSPGNRTWVLTDFDRHILKYWQPKGTNVIFGDSYIEKKKRTGFHLCDHCGMLEQQPAQFPSYKDVRFCTEECLQALLDAKRIPSN